MKNKTWYLADLIISITVENDSNNVIHINTVLVHAFSDDDAYEKANELGKEEESEYQNPEGNKVIFKFEGLGDIYHIYDDKLEHGTEIIYEEKINVSHEKLNNWIRNKEELSIFSSRQTITDNKPNYLSKEIYDAMIDDGFTEEELK
jgi:hypothetical protein